MSKLRVAWFSPLPVDGDSGDSPSAYFTKTILPLVDSELDLELFYNGFDSYLEYPTYHFLKAFDRHKSKPFDVFFYQLEDRRESDYLRIQAGLEPGVVLFHDLYFSTFGPEPILNSSWKEVAARFQERTAEWPARDGEFDQKGPLGFREASQAAVALFSNVANHAEYQRSIDLRFFGEEVPSYYLPNPVESFSASSKGRSGLTIAFCGSPHVQHRGHKLCDALSQHEGNYSLKWMLDEDEHFKAVELCEEFGITSVEFTIGRSPERWSEVVGEADLAVHTLFSVFGQTGPYLEISLAAGVPTVVTKFGGADALSDDLVFKVRPGDTEAAELRSILKAVSGSDCSNLSSSFAKENYSAEVIGQELLKVFQMNQEYLADVRESWSDFQSEARSALLEEVLPQDLLSRTLVEPIFKELEWSV